MINMVDTEGMPNTIFRETGDKAQAAGAILVATVAHHDGRVQRSTLEALKVTNWVAIAIPDDGAISKVDDHDYLVTFTNLFQALLFDAPTNHNFSPRGIPMRVVIFIRICVLPGLDVSASERASHQRRLGYSHAKSALTTKARCHTVL
jgi:hypothetical protein